MGPPPESEKETIKETILVVDDNQNIVKLIQVNLEYEGYNTLVAFDGEEAIQKAKSYLPSLIILDVLMPKKSGWEVLDALKNDPSTSPIPVIMLTAMGQKSDLKRGWEGGVENYLTKPFNPIRLLDAVREALDKAKEDIEKKDSSQIIYTSTPVSSVKASVKVGIVGGGEIGIKVLQSLLGNTSVITLGIADPDPDAPAIKLAKDLRLFTTKDATDIINLAGLDILIAASPELISPVLLEKKPPNVEILSPYATKFVWNLLEEKESNEEKIRSFLKDLYALYEASKAIGAQIDLNSTLDAALGNMLTAMDAKGGAILLWEGDKFYVKTVRNLLLPQTSWVARNVIEPLLPKNELVAFFSTTDELLNKLPWKINSSSENVAFITLIAARSSHISTLSHTGKLNSTGSSNPSLLGLVILYLGSRLALSQDERTFLSTLSAHASIAIENAILYQSAREKQRLVEELLSKVIDAQEEERKRIAGEIHDSVAQSLVTMLTKVQTCEAYCKTYPNKVPGELEELRKVVSDAVKETRQILFNLRPSTLDDLGLIPTLENYFKKFEGETNISTEFVLKDFTIKLSPHVETIVYRMVQEALANVKKHAQARKIRVLIAVKNERLILEVIDDGVGFEVENLHKQLLKSDSMGLTGMRERATFLGGALLVKSKPGKGTTLSVEIPITEYQVPVNSVESVSFEEKFIS